MIKNRLLHYIQTTQVAVKLNIAYHNVSMESDFSQLEWGKRRSPFVTKAETPHYVILYQVSHDQQLASSPDHRLEFLTLIIWYRGYKAIDHVNPSRLRLLFLLPGPHQ